MVDGTVRDVLLGSTTAEFHAPDFLLTEVGRHSGRIAARSGLALASVHALLEDISETITFVPEPAYAAVLPEATRAARAAGASGDEQYVALAFWLDAPVWSLDKDLRRIARLQVLSTGEVDKL